MATKVNHLTAWEWAFETALQSLADNYEISFSTPSDLFELETNLLIGAGYFTRLNDIMPYVKKGV